VNIDDEKYPCPCCGHLVHDFAPGHHQSCPICGWEDNLVQLRFPLMPGSANMVSLERGQRNFREYGAAERRYIGKTREPDAADRREHGWRPLDPARDNIEEPRRGENYAETYPYENTAVLYYWRDTYWRRLVS
jgi:hypothetical protein